MVNYLIRRAFQMMIVVLLSTLAIYLLLNVAPGGPLSGIRLGSSDRKNRISDAEVKKLEAYLGLDKPLALRYIVWLIGDDWLGADWMYVGLTPYPVTKTAGIDRGKSEGVRFWSNPGVAQLNPGYPLLVWGTEVEENVFEADKIIVKPAIKEDSTGSVVKATVISQSGWEITAQDLNGNSYTIIADKDTQFTYPKGEAEPRPADGTWVNVSPVFGAGGLLGKYAGFHGDTVYGTHGILRMDFGRSWKTNLPVIDLIKSRLGNTVTLMTTAIVLSLLIGVPIGIYSAVHQYSKTDYAVTTFAFFGSAMPVFWFGLMLILIFSYQFKQWGLPFFPATGVDSARAAPPGSLLDALNATPKGLIDRVVHLILPAAMLSLLYMAGWSRYSRSSMLEVLRQDYVRTARAKGLTERVVVIKHALRNALIPVVTILVFDIAGIFSGAILTETVFSYPGMGTLYFSALSGNDWPVVMAYLFITAILVVIATLIRDVVYTIVDPRIRFS